MDRHEPFEITADACIGLGELARLLEAAGYGARAGHLAAALIDRGFASYTAVAHARDAHGQLVGCVGAFSDGALTTLIGALIVHPQARRPEVARALVHAVQRECVAPARALRTA